MNYKAEDCMFFNSEAKNHRCSMQIHCSNSGGLYNCKKKGICKVFKLESEHIEEVEIRKEARDKREYLRLKQKYEGTKK